jgi:2-phosphoglycerate kinase
LKKTKTKVYLIGGPPGVGKSTLGLVLGARLGIASLSVDDFTLAAQAITTPETHPGLHVMRRVPSTEYFTDSSVEQLKSDATAQHEATWPLVERVVRIHATRESAIVIDGWHMRPRMVAQMELDNVWSGWIVPSDSVLEEPESRNEEFVRKSTNPQRMLENFLARSFWFNDLIKREATELQMNILPQPGETSVDELCQMVLDGPVG